MTIAILAALSLVQAAGASAVDVALRVSTTSAALGQAVEVSAVAALPPGAKLELDLQRTTTDAFSVTPVEDAAGQETGTGPAPLRLSILPLSLGRLPIDLYWRIDTASAAAAVEKPSTIVLDVTGPELQKDPSPVDIKEPRAARPALWPWLLAALVGAALWELYRRRRAQPGAPLAAPLPIDNRPPEVIALSQLDALEHSDLWPQSRFKDFYFTLTEVMRHYLERRFGMPATRLTTSELYRQMREAEIDRPLAVLFKDIFDRADLVKFAKIAPETDWGAKDISGARSLVQQTTPKDFAPSEAGGAKS